MPSFNDRWQTVLLLPFPRVTTPSAMQTNSSQPGNFNAGVIAKFGPANLELIWWPAILWRPQPSPYTNDQWWRVSPTLFLPGNLSECWETLFRINRVWPSSDQILHSCQVGLGMNNLKFAICIGTCLKIYSPFDDQVTLSGMPCSLASIVQGKAYVEHV